MTKIPSFLNNLLLFLAEWWVGWWGWLWGKGIRRSRNGVWSTNGKDCSLGRELINNLRDSRESHKRMIGVANWREIILLFWMLILQVFSTKFYRNPFHTLKFMYRNSALQCRVSITYHLPLPSTLIILAYVWKCLVPLIFPSGTITSLSLSLTG